MGSFDLANFPNDDALAQFAAGEWLRSAAEAGRFGRAFTTALSGGRIAKKFYSSIVAEAKATKISLSHAHFFWADERCVPPDDAESNYHLARELFFQPLGISENQIHRIRGEEDPQFSAKEAEAEICRAAPMNSDGQPVLDLVLLGMGEDGHVASLFPGEAEEFSASPAVFRAVKNSPKPPSHRVTLGYAAIAAAKNVWVLVSGEAKRAVLQKSLLGSGATPLARVIQMRSSTRLLADFPPG